MIDKLEEISHRFEEVGQLLVQPDIISDMKRYSQLNKEYKDLDKIVTKFREIMSLNLLKISILQISDYFVENLY